MDVRVRPAGLRAAPRAIERIAPRPAHLGRPTPDAPGTHATDPVAPPFAAAPCDTRPRCEPLPYRGPRPSVRASTRRHRGAAAAPPAPARPTSPAARRGATAVNATRPRGEPAAPGRRAGGARAAPRDLPPARRARRRARAPTAMDATADGRRRRARRARPTTCWTPSARVPGRRRRGPTPVRLEELLLIRVANENPAARPLRALVDDTPVPATERARPITALEPYQAAGCPSAPTARRSSSCCARRPAPTPTSLAGQLRYVREHWGALLGDALDALLDRLLLTLDVIGEEERGLHLRFGGAGGRRRPGRGEAPDLSGLDAEPERFSSDSAWMPRLVLIAKSTHVWLDQLSRRTGARSGRSTRSPTRSSTGSRAGASPGLWLIGLWERSAASRGSRSGAATRTRRPPPTRSTTTRSPTTSAARRPGPNLRHRAWARGIRLASDMVPNHMGIDSRWVIEHPSGSCPCPSPPTPATRSAARTSPTTSGSRSGSRTTTGTTATPRSCSSGATADRRAALHLPRQRRHELPLERHRAARLHPGRGPRAGHPDDPRGRAAVPGHPLRRRDGPRQEARPAAVVPGARRGRRASPRAPSTAR